MTAHLDLSAVQARADAAANVTGISIAQLTVTVVATITTPDGAVFAPALTLTLSPLQLALADPSNALVVTDPSSQPQPALPRLVMLFGHAVPAATLRRVAAVAVPLSVVSGAVILALAYRRRPGDEAAHIGQRYRPQLVPVAPLEIPPERDVVDVQQFATLAKLADRYGLLIMYWQSADEAVFVVWDDGAVYRYRTTNAGGADTEVVGMPEQSADAVVLNPPWAPSVGGDDTDPFPAPWRPDARHRDARRADAGAGGAAAHRRSVDEQLTAWRKEQRMHWNEAVLSLRRRGTGDVQEAEPQELNDNWPAEWRIPLPRSASADESLPPGPRAPWDALVLGRGRDACGLGSSPGQAATREQAWTPIVWQALIT